MKVYLIFFLFLIGIQGHGTYLGIMSRKTDMNVQIIYHHSHRAFALNHLLSHN